MPTGARCPYTTLFRSARPREGAAMARTWQAWQAVAVLVTALAPACAEAAWLGYKNDTPAAIVVQSASMVGSQVRLDRKSTRLNSSHLGSSYAVFCLNK